jgi:hypothetical protein
VVLQHEFSLLVCHIKPVPNQRAPHMRRATITVGTDLYEWAMLEARRRGINDFSTFVRVLIAAEKNKERRKHGKNNPD